jgi:hypothetical protein
MYCEVSAASRDDLGKYAQGFFSGGVGKLAGLFGGASQAATAPSISLEKAWHGLHYLLTGEVWEGSGPLAFLLAGGEQLGDDDEMPVRWFTPEETAEIHRALSAVSDKQLWSRFDPEAMEEQQIYPGIWDEDEADLKEEYLGYFHELKAVVAEAVKANQGLVVSIG